MVPTFYKDSDAHGYEGSLNNSQVPTAITGSMTWRCYGPSGFIASGTATLFDSPTLTAVYKWVITTTDPVFERGVLYDVWLQYTVSGVARQSLHRFQLT